MTSINQKHQIVESLSSLDQAQTAQVLDYIKSLVQPVRDDQRIKREALQQIRQALGNSRALNLSF